MCVKLNYMQNETVWHSRKIIGSDPKSHVQFCKIFVFTILFSIGPIYLHTSLCQKFSESYILYSIYTISNRIANIIKTLKYQVNII